MPLYVVRNKAEAAVSIVLMLMIGVPVVLMLFALVWTKKRRQSKKRAGG